ncbi:MAG: hypothetical protein ABIP80_07410 [Ferruginibacter sp.]
MKLDTPEEHINRIYKKVQGLKRKVILLQKENEGYLKEIERLILQKDADELHMKGLTEQNYILKASTNQMSADDKLAMEKALGKYIQEIDKCISLLSD